MAKTYNRLEIDVNKKPNSIITEVQGDSNSRYLDVSLFNNGVPLDLTGHEVKIFMVKPENGGEIWNDGVITDATAGRCEFLMTAEALSKVGHLQTQISVWKDNTEILSTQVFEINVTKTLLGNSSVESSNEYGTLVLLFQNLYEAHDLMTTMVQNIGLPAEVAAQYNLATMWQAWEFLVAYIKGDFTDKVDEAIANSSVQGVLDKIGTSTDSEESTVFGKENAILENMKNTIPLYRPDDYLVQAVAKKFVLLQSEETSAPYDNPTRIGTINLPDGCAKMIIKGKFKGNSVKVEFYYNGKRTYYTDYFDNGMDAYVNQELVLETGQAYQSPLDVYLYCGSGGTAYCNNLEIEACTLKRIVTENLFQAGTIKSYGATASNNAFLPQCPRLDRVSMTQSRGSGYFYFGTIVKVDNIPYIRAFGSDMVYKIMY